MVTIEPPFNNVSAGRPVVFEFFGFGFNTEPVDRAIVKLFLDGSSDVTTEILAFPYRIVENVLPNVNAYFFKVDVSRYLEDSLAPFAGGFDHYNLSDCTGYINQYAKDFRLLIEYYIIDLEGLLVKSVFAPDDSTNEFTAINIPRQQTEDMYLEGVAGDQTAPYNPSKFAEVLTNSPNSISSCYNKRLSLSVLANESEFQLNAFFIEAFDVNGNSLGTEAYNAVDINANTTEILSTELTFDCLHELRLNGFELGTGVDVTLVEDTGNTIINPTGIPIDYSDPNSYKDIVKLEFFFGFLFEIGELELVQNTQRKVICYENLCCCSDDRLGITLHWLNCLSGVDSRTFCTDVKKIKTVTATQAKKALSWDEASTNPNNIQDVGRFRINVDAVNSYRVTTKPLAPQESVYISELLTSVKIYREDSEKRLISVVINDIEQTVLDSKGRVVYQFTVVDSNNDKKQRI